MSGTLIILNGASSSGKSTLAHVLQNMLDPPFIFLQVDAFIKMLPKALFQVVSSSSPLISTGKGFYFVKTKDSHGNVSTDIVTGIYGQRLIRGYAKCLKALIDCENNVIADAIISTNEQLQLIKETFQGVKVYIVCLYAPLEVLEEREKRDSKIEGLARGRYEAVYSGKNYDLLIDTSQLSVEEAARQIKDFITTFHP